MKLLIAAAWMLSLLAACGSSSAPPAKSADQAPPWSHAWSVPEEASELPDAPVPEKRFHAEHVVINQRAPELIVEQWLTDAPELAGKMVLVDFWATFCPPCKDVIPELNAFHEEFGERLVVIGLSEESATAVRAMKEPAIQYFSAVDRETRTHGALGIGGIPHCIVVDPTGVVRWQGFPLDPEHRLTREVLSGLLDTYAPAG